MASLSARQNILLTGGAGFLGRGILRYLENSKSPANVTIYSRDELKHYKVKQRFPHVRTVLGDVRDLDRLTAVMAGHDLVLHAAALKHIPEAERDVAEAIAVNVIGSQNVAYAALRTGVKDVVGISTDKTCSPRNSYGATKMLMERLFQEAGRLSDTRFTCVRYGNVVSSTGSVVPLFREQIRRDGEVTITSQAMTRFWISIDDAVALIDKAATDTSRRGYTYVARCAGMSIVNVAQAVWQLEGRTGPVKYRIIGTRPGEKLHEVLVDAYEAPYAMEDGPYVLIPPAMGLAGEGSSGVMPYESSLPVRNLEPDEFAALVRDADSV